MTEQEAITIYEAILELLAEEGPLSTHQITEQMNARGVRINGNGQTLNRMRNLERRNRVRSVDGERGRLWQLV